MSLSVVGGVQNNTSRFPLPASRTLRPCSDPRRLLSRNPPATPFLLLPRTSCPRPRPRPCAPAPAPRCRRRLSAMSRVTQSRQQTEANAKILRALVKSADNKVCVDCKKNDPRWASWNLGCFLCIRCSGIHRSMGTHISKGMSFLSC